MTGYTTREVADVLGLPTSRILSWTKTGLLTPARGPRGGYVYSFQDIVLLRTARELLGQNVPAKRVRRALAALSEQLPRGRPLSAVHVSALGDQVLVRDADTVWDPDSGQVQIDFAVADVTASAEPVAQRTLDRSATEPVAQKVLDRSGAETVAQKALDRSGAEPVAQKVLDRSGFEEDRSADDWYDSALDLEAVSGARAKEAYERALELDPGHADAHLNLGRLLHEDGALTEAEARYRSALAADPVGARAMYNLGVVLEDQRRTREAVEAYEGALRLDDRLGLAHFNLARLHEAAGRKAEAIRHLQAYRTSLAEA